MSYDPSPRTPPRQERWPQATPAEGWPSYRDGEGEPAGRHSARAQQAGGSHRRQAGARSAVATAAFPVAGDAYLTAGTTDPASHDVGAYGTGAYDAAAYDTGGFRVGDYTAGSRAREGYGQPGAADRYAAAADGFDRAAYAEPWNSRSLPQAGYGQADGGYGQADGGYGQAESGYGQAGDGYRGRAVDGYAGTAGGTGRTPDGYPDGAAYLGPGSYTETAYSAPAYAAPGYSDAGYDAGPEYFAPGYPDSGYSEPGLSDRGYSEPGYSEPGYSDRGYSEPGYSDPGYFGSGYSDPGLAAPDADVDPYSWQADQALRRAAGHRGVMVSAATEVLATAVVIGVTTLAAGLLKSTVSPVSALGTLFVDRTPAALRSVALNHFGTHGRAVLLLGMYAVIAVIAIAIGVAARRAAALGVTGIAAFALFVAFIAVTRPGSHVSDVMPAVIGGLAGVAALLWLVRASAPIQEDIPLRPARGGTRRRTR